MKAITHQGETLDDVLWRVLKDTSALSQAMQLNPHALFKKLPAGVEITLPKTSSAPKKATITLWGNDETNV